MPLPRSLVRPGSLRRCLVCAHAPAACAGLVHAASTPRLTAIWGTVWRSDNALYAHAAAILTRHDDDAAGDAQKVAPIHATSAPDASDQVDVGIEPPERLKDTLGQAIAKVGHHRPVSPYPPHISPSRNARKARRPNRAALLHNIIQRLSPNLVLGRSKGKSDYAHTSPRRFLAGGKSRKRVVAQDGASEAPEPLHGAAASSLHSVLARSLEDASGATEDGIQLTLTQKEAAYLDSQGLSATDVHRWSTSLVAQDSHIAFRTLVSGTPPPLTLVLLFLRRTSISKQALATMLRHIDSRLAHENISLPTLKILMVRLVRHLREKWPEAMPWLTAVFTTEATRIHSTRSRTPHRMLSDMTHFCNAFMALLAMPATSNPIVSSLHQQTAQFQVLRFMASCQPALIVTRAGFRAVAKVQLAHAKTSQEQEWSSLKGPSWPPWKHNRTAMDEGKGYEFGVSRASRILHRLFDAGYPGDKWEDVAEIYAGWDTDLSPTIQTRTLLPELSVYTTELNNVEGLLWAARVKTTRTRREAWACFLMCEASTAVVRPEVYHAMFEKIHHRDSEPVSKRAHLDSIDMPAHTYKAPLPGDSKEVLPEPRSPLDRIHIAEPVPTFEQLYHRMTEKGIRPSGRLLAFLVESTPDFDIALGLLESAKNDFNGQLQQLLDASCLVEVRRRQQLPGYMMTSFIRLLCRFGKLSHPTSLHPSLSGHEDHQQRFRHDRDYLMEYAYILLTHLRPQHRPAWTAYMERLLFGGWVFSAHKGQNKVETQYSIMSELIRIMREEGIDLDDDQFKLFCTVVRCAAQQARRGSLLKDVQDNIISRTRQLRTLFQSLICSHANPSAGDADQRKSHVHVPPPAVLHAYVRALGVLRDYEGLYSFSGWAVNHHKAISERAHAQRGGSKAWRRTLVALRAALDGKLESNATAAPQELILLVKSQIKGVPGWGGWPSDHEVALYTKFKFRDAST